MAYDETISKQLFEAYQAAPAYIREFIETGKFRTFMATLTQRLTLRLDVADKVSNEILLVILGLAEPIELPGNLVNVGVPEEQVGVVLEETNKAIFEPLRQTVRELQTPATPPIPPVTIQPKVREVPPPPSYLPTAPIPDDIVPVSPAVTNPIPTPAPAPVVAAPTPVPPPVISQAPAPEPIAPVVPVPVPASAPEIPHARTMQADIEAMQNGGVVTPVSAPEPMSVPTPAPKAPTPVPPTPSATPSEKDIHEDLKKYGIDPYREPVE